LQAASIIFNDIEDRERDKEHQRSVIAIASGGLQVGEAYGASVFVAGMG